MYDFSIKGHLDNEKEKCQGELGKTMKLK